MTKGGRQLRTLVVAVVLMVIAGFVPAFVMGLVGWADGVNVGFLAGTAVLIACLGGTGWRTGLVISLPFALFAGLANWAAANPWLAAIVLAGAALVRGYAAKAGMHDALTMAVIALGFIVTSPVSVAGSLPVTSAAYVALLCLACGLWATLVIFLLRRRLHVHQHTGLDPIRVVTYSLTLAGLVGVATWFVIDLGLGHTGGWIILTILVVFQPSLGAGFKKAAARAAGTVLGIAFAFLVGLVHPANWLVSLLGTVLLIASLLFMLQGRPYWLFVAFLTPGIVLLDSAGSTVQLVAEQRLGATLIGVLGTVVVMLALAPLSTRLFSERTPTRQSLSERPSRQV
jgi:hypothetical protein